METLLNTKLNPLRPFQKPKVKIPSELEESFHNWRSAFSEVSLEVGCGNGFHPVQWAKKNSDCGLIAVERTLQKSKSFLERIKGHPQLNNLFPICGEALEVLPFLLQAESIENLYLLYPNPYPKKSQENKRWYHNSFFSFLYNSLKPGGKVYFRTNEKWKIDEAKEFFPKNWPLILTQSQRLQGKQDSYSTHFEKKYLERGESCFLLVFQKPIS